ncbi:MAG: ABC1 kinase family protein [Roseateles sp.]|uniref:ABC1 kinase family protein n=1 Tax=Roseateles sp. TaxID=1971397 RepID=UPI004036E36D
MKTGRLSRSSVAAGAALRLGSAQLLHDARRRLGAAPDEQAHQTQLGDILFKALDQLKGTGLKAAQLLSLDLGVLPEGLRERLAQGHHQATPALNRAHVIQLLRQELGGAPQEHFAEFEPQAFAAASLGQVHRARAFDGERLAVKLQYPGMAAAVRSDLRLLRGLLGTPGLGLPSPGVVGSTLDDIELKVLEELDYRREAAELDWFRAHTNHPHLVLPRVRHELSGARVLSLSLLDGLHLDAWLNTAPSQAERDHFGQLLFDQFWHGVRQLRRIQADPHPGNYLFMPQGRLGLLDFGRTLALGEGFCAGLQAAWAAHAAGQSEDLFKAYLAMGLLSPDLSLARFRTELLPALRPLLDWQILPWREPVFDFAHHLLPPSLQAGRAVRREVVTRHLHRIPPEMPFFDRSHIGLTELLRRLGARVHTGSLGSAAA